MSTLELLGHLEDFQTFVEPLDIDRVAALELVTPNDFIQFSDLADLGRRVGGHEELLAVIESLLDQMGTVEPARS
jgi:hypothetical protein